jgi:hypothetical protein
MPQSSTASLTTMSASREVALPSCATAQATYNSMYTLTATSAYTTATSPGQWMRSGCWLCSPHASANQRVAGSSTGGWLTCTCTGAVPPATPQPVQSSWRGDHSWLVESTTHMTLDSWRCWGKEHYTAAEHNVSGLDWVAVRVCFRLGKLVHTYLLTSTVGVTSWYACL